MTSSTNVYSVAPQVSNNLAAVQMELERARIEDSLSRGLSHRPTPEELKQQGIIKGK